MRTKIAVFACVAAATTLLSASANADTVEANTAQVARLVGAADFTIPFIHDNDTRHFAFDVRQAPYTKPKPGLPVPQGLPTDAEGTVTIRHHVPDQNLRLWFEAEADCMATAPGAATVTAVVTKAHPMVADLVGKRLGFSVQDNGPGRKDRVGLSWTVVNLVQDDNGEWRDNANTGTCMAPAPFATVVRGNYKVTHAELTTPPAQG